MMHEIYAQEFGAYVSELLEDTGIKKSAADLVDLQAAVQEWNEPLHDSMLPELIERQETLLSEILDRMLQAQPHVQRTKKVRIFPNKTQRTAINVWAADSRRVWNEAVDLHRSGLKKDEIRKGCVRVTGNARMERTKRTPEHVRQKAYDKFSGCVKACETRGNGNIKYRSSKAQTQAIGLQKRDVKVDAKGIRFFGPKAFPGHVRAAEEVSPEDLECDPEIIKSRGRYYLCLVRNEYVSRPPPLTTPRVVSLDMGIRKFASIYSPAGDIGLIGSNVGSFLTRLLRRKKALEVAKREVKESDRWRWNRLHKGWCKVSNRITNLVKELHNKVSLYLARNYDIILIGKLTRGVLQGNMSKENKLLYSTLRHYGFRQRLIQRGHDHGKDVRVVSESLTTKTCTRCGFINWKMKGEEWKVCPKCHLMIDRDIHSARAIWLKNSERL